MPGTKSRDPTRVVRGGQWGSGRHKEWDVSKFANKPELSRDFDHVTPFFEQSSSNGGGRMSGFKAVEIEVESALTEASSAANSSPLDVHSSGPVVGDACWTVPAPIGPGDPSVLSGATITVVDDGQRVAPLVAVLLKSHGATALVVEPHEIPERSDGIIHLGQLHAGTQAAANLFEDVYPVAMAGATTVVAVTGFGGTHGQCVAEDGADIEIEEDEQAGGVAMLSEPSRKSIDRRDRAESAVLAESPDLVSAPGVVDTANIANAVPAADLSDAAIPQLFDALAAELPRANVRAVDVDCLDDPVVLAGRIVAEALAAGGPVAVGYRNDRRCTLVSTDPAMLEENGDHNVAWGRMKPITDRRESALLIA